MCVCVCVCVRERERERERERRTKQQHRNKAIAVLGERYTGEEMTCIHVLLAWTESNQNRVHDEYTWV